MRIRIAKATNARRTNARLFGGCFAAALILILPSHAFPGDWKAGAARGKITPTRPMWMSGYGGRDHPAEGTSLDLWAKALVLEDPQGRRIALVTLDLVGIDRDFSQAVCSAIGEKYHLSRAQIALCSSHTHSGPVVGRTLSAMYFLDDAQRQDVADYTAELEGKLVALVGEALERLAPAQLAWGNGHSTIAVNRRNNKEADVPKLREEGRLKGPVDYDVPVLAVRRPGGELAAVVFGYACHATVLPFYEWSGDYPGFAQAELEKLHPDAVALFFAGCGGDQNPLPRKSVDLAREYGRSLAASVNAVLSGVMNAIEGNLEVKYSENSLSFGKLPTRDDIVAQSHSADKFVASRGRLLLRQIEAGRPLAAVYPYPIQLWRLGNELQWLTLGGEVVVDYSLRLKKELGADHTWVAAYTNDVMAYIPSKRVLDEGGYEGGGAMVYYGLPSPWSADVEETIVNGVHALFSGKEIEK